MKTIEIKLDEKTVQVNKLPAKKYISILKQLRELPKKLSEVSDFSDMNNQKFFELLPDMIEKCQPEVFAILSEATGLEVAEIEELGLHEVVELTTGVIEVNKYLEVYMKIKKFSARPTEPVM